MEFIVLKPDPDLPPFTLFRLGELICFLDATHATDLRTRKSVMGIMLLFCGAVIAYKSHLTSTVATSATEAEFLAAVFAGKMVKYFRFILAALEELGLKQNKPTCMVNDCEAAEAMVNERKPTNHA